MDIGAYRSYLTELVREAIENSDGTPRGIATYLHEKKEPGFLSRNRSEKRQALQDARKAFDEHLHWPLDITISHLGVDPDAVKDSE
jgi:hypothetical protein